MDANRLTFDDDRAIINRTWIIIDRYRNEIGARIFETIFEQSPDMKQLFMSNDVDIEWSKTIELHQHKFMQSIETAVKLLDNAADFESYMNNLGKIHAKARTTGSFRPYYWSVFMEAILLQFRKAIKRSTIDKKEEEDDEEEEDEDEQTDQHKHLTDDDIDRAIIVWRSLLRTIVKRMKVGYHQAESSKSNLPIVNNQSYTNSKRYAKDPSGMALPFRRLDMHARPAKISLML